MPNSQNKYYLSYKNLQSLVMDYDKTNMFDEFVAQQTDWEGVHSSLKFMDQEDDQLSPSNGESESASQNSSEESLPKDAESTLPNLESSEYGPPQPAKVTREKKGSLKKRNIDYEKNLCGYISKSCVLEFLDPKGRRRAEYYCQKRGCSYEEAISYYKAMLGKVFGVGLLGELLVPESEEEVGVKQAFGQFMVWFLRHRYPLYVIKNGKMEDKAIYLEYKNKYILYVESVISKVF